MTRKSLKDEMVLNPTVTPQMVDAALLAWYRVTEYGVTFASLRPDPEDLAIERTDMQRALEAALKADRRPG